jgi:hypothetical protein
MLDAECHAAGGIMFTYSTYITSANKSFFESVLGMHLRNITFRIVPRHYLARTGMIGIVCTVWYAVFSDAL